MLYYDKYITNIKRNETHTKHILNQQQYILDYNNTEDHY